MQPQTFFSDNRSSSEPTTVYDAQRTEYTSMEDLGIADLSCYCQPAFMELCRDECDNTRRLSQRLATALFTHSGTQSPHYDSLPDKIHAEGWSDYEHIRNRGKSVNRAHIPTMPPHKKADWNTFIIAGALTPPDTTTTTSNPCTPADSSELLSSPVLAASDPPLPAPMSPLSLPDCTTSPFSSVSASTPFTPATSPEHDPTSPSSCHPLPTQDSVLVTFSPPVHPSVQLIELPAAPSSPSLIPCRLPRRCAPIPSLTPLTDTDTIPKPKRPRNPFFLFKSALCALGTHPKKGNTPDNVARIWYAMSPDQREPWDALGEIERRRWEDVRDAAGTAGRRRRQRGRVPKETKGVGKRKSAGGEGSRKRRSADTGPSAASSANLIATVAASSSSRHPRQIPGVTGSDIHFVNDLDSTAPALPLPLPPSNYGSRPLHFQHYVLDRRSHEELLSTGSVFSALPKPTQVQSLGSYVAPFNPYATNTMPFYYPDPTFYDAHLDLRGDNWS
ncbi:hypothetical protein CONPUDRAFT_168025 [Coniophora puteana RWD-64-598 SS2]|uniref:HMG box domain-containing protein n=1 Tax=Coniophora puteana (strain RWD-64-598) TaxID=741705 RepID=A0A5M3MFP9_CONPW|nr:uncharacterized protein CONPUDRAFT_168025 [Coniophora puteana RWD-64-598 SS2]EIW78089.1 hypothetical protein CONPUDRAFT_168025 [Coniophora puteana RWD-64-598 SS2]